MGKKIQPDDQRIAFCGSASPYREEDVTYVTSEAKVHPDNNSLTLVALDSSGITHGQEEYRQTVCERSASQKGQQEETCEGVASATAEADQG